MESLKCPHCGSNLEDVGAVCSACGKEAKDQKKPSLQKDKGRGKNLYSLLGFLLVVVAGVGLLMKLDLIPNPFGNGSTAAIVNGERISMAEVDRKMEAFKKLHANPARPDSSSPEGKASLDEVRKQILKAMIHEKILLTEAKKLGLTPSRQEIADQIQAIKTGMKFTEKDFNDFLKKHSMDLADFEKKVERDLLISKLMARGKEKGLTPEAWVQAVMARAQVEILEK